MTSPSTPAGTALLVGLLNTRPHAGGGELLRTPSDAERELSVSDVSDEELARLRELRDAISDAVGGSAIAWEELNRQSAVTPFVFQFDSAAVRAVPSSPARIRTDAILALVDLVKSGNWNRLRFCPNDQCQLAFFDTTRNRSQRWDSYETCGNRANVAALRARRRAAIERG
ncbi:MULTISPECIES: CGNR zinc finger domain-containing protein [unclassified Curtobacterium]|uniref:CGNR zinc finger domain-containing protein n=1 Tax=unclassified Curtobacterium TaxID=257496 RepID=UPI0015E87833|nr:MULTISPECIES: CGNR zinc finger domain-containing protein [unclassified Curtobacterium]